MPGRQDKESSLNVNLSFPDRLLKSSLTTLQSAIEGSVHILREAEKANIKKVVVTGSIVTFPGTGPFGVAGMPLLRWNSSFGSLINRCPTDWNPITKGDALGDTGTDLVVYVAAKTLAERAILEFVDAHPQIDVTIRK